MATDERWSFEYEYLGARLTEVQEAIAAVSDDDLLFGDESRRRLSELEHRLRLALASYELESQTRNVSR